MTGRLGYANELAKRTGVEIDGHCGNFIAVRSSLLGYVEQWPRHDLHVESLHGDAEERKQLLPALRVFLLQVDITEELHWNGLL